MTGTGLETVLEVDRLTTEIVFGGGSIVPVRDVSLSVGRGETLCVVGESGSGKSLLALSIMRVLPSGARIVAGGVRLSGEDLAGAKESRLRRIRGSRMAMVLQDPMTAFDPLIMVGDQIVETIRAHERIPKKDARRRTIALLEQVRLPDPERAARTLPSALSGGMNQRALIAMALATDPVLLIADEPTTALDVTVQAQVLELIRDLQVSRGLAVILISHDMGVAAMVGHRIAVMYAGRIVETGPTAELFRAPRHPYTVGLMAAARDEGRRQGARASIRGVPPDLQQLPPGCAFAPRCDFVRPQCEAGPPALRPFGLTNAACILEDPERPWLQPARQEAAADA